MDKKTETFLLVLVGVSIINHFNVCVDYQCNLKSMPDTESKAGFSYDFEQSNSVDMVASTSAVFTGE